jgi:hypothetical protein
MAAAIGEALSSPTPAPLRIADVVRIERRYEHAACSVSKHWKRRYSGRTECGYPAGRKMDRSSSITAERRPVVALFPPSLLRGISFTSFALAARQRIRTALPMTSSACSPAAASRDGETEPRRDGEKRADINAQNDALLCHVFTFT